MAAAGCAWMAHGLLLEHRGAEARWPGWTAFGLATLACTLAACALAIGWALLLRALNPGSDTLAAMRAYALSQPAKYLPGNVAHFGARHWLGRNAGLSHAQLLWATTLESMILIGCALIGAGSDESALPAPWLQHAPLPLAGVLLLLAATALAFHQTRRPAAIMHVLATIGCTALYFGLTCAALAWLAGDIRLAWQLLPAACLSWVAGYLVIGAPGGVGVRESVLTQMLPAVAARALVVTAAVTLRLALILGELLMFAAAWLASSRKPPG